MANYIDINPPIIRWALERSGLTLNDFRLPVADWISGTAKPTLRMLEDFAKKAMVPFGYLFLNSPPVEKLPVPDFRTFRDESLRQFSPNLLDSINEIQRRQNWMREQLIEGGNAPLGFIGSVSSKDSVESAASSIRKVLQLSDNWTALAANWGSALRTLRAAIESAGVFVCVTNQVGLNTRRPLNHEEFRGFVLVDKYAPWIFVNANDTMSAQMFTLVHEMLYVLLGKSGLFNLEKFDVAEDDVERYCSQVAAEFLTPKFYGQEMENRQELKQRNKNKPAQIFWQQQQLRLGDRFGYAVTQAYAARKLLPSEAQDLTGFSRGTFSKYAQGMIRRKSGAAPAAVRTYS